MYECKVVGLDYFESAPYLFKAAIEAAASPEQVFECFEDAQSWPAWAPPITHVEWTSPKPYDLGTTRRVSMTGIVGDEVFIGWDYPNMMAFCFTHCSQSLIESFAEKWTVTDLGDGKVRVEWTMGMTPKGFGKFTLALSRPFMGMANQFMLNRFKKYLEKRYA